MNPARSLLVIFPLVASATLFAADTPPLPSGDETVIRDLETKSWMAWKNRDGAFFEQFLSDDHVEVHAFGIVGKAAVVAGVRSPVCVVKAYGLGPFSLTRVAPDSVLVTYRAEQDTSCDSQKVPSPVWATSLYAKRDGRWVNVLYQHTPIQGPQPLVVAVDSPKWDLQGQAKAVEYQGRKSIFLDGGAAVLNDFEMRDGVIDVDIATPASRGFFGIQFRIAADGANAEWVYLRQHKSGAPDAMQYTPVLNTGLNWQIYNGPGFTGAVDIPKDAWFHLRLVVTGAQAKLYVKDMDKPALVMEDLKSGIQKGQLALAALTGATYFSNFEVRTTPDAAWERHLPPMPAGTLTRWSLSPSYDALERDLERSLTASERDAIKWQDVEAEAPGFVVINRYRESPHPRVTFANDFSKRLDPQPGMKVVYARTRIDSDRDQVKKLYIGYSDDVSVFLNGRILYRGRSAQNFRDPAFLGIVNAENDAVYLPLKKGSNELVLAVSELGGGWGFICRLSERND